MVKGDDVLAASSITTSDGGGNGQGKYVRISNAGRRKLQVAAGVDFRAIMNKFRRSAMAPAQKTSSACPESGWPFVESIEVKFHCLPILAVMSTTTATPSPDISERELVISRVIAASPERVYQAWTRRLPEWWGPHGMITPVCEMDLRAG